MYTQNVDQKWMRVVIASRLVCCEFHGTIVFEPHSYNGWSLDSSLWRSMLKKRKDVGFPRTRSAKKFMHPFSGISFTEYLQQGKYLFTCFSGNNQWKRFWNRCVDHPLLFSRIDPKRLILLETYYKVFLFSWFCRFLEVMCFSFFGHDIFLFDKTS